MFDQFNGLPVHVLLVHAAVVFVPLLAVASVVYAVVPRWRSRIGWAAALLAIGAPVAALFAKISGEQFQTRLAGQGLPAEILAKIGEHQGFGNRTLLASAALGVVTGIMIYLTSRAAKGSPSPRAVDLGLTVVVVLLAVASGYYVFRTGDSGATIVWGSTS